MQPRITCFNVRWERLWLSVPLTSSFRKLIEVIEVRRRVLYFWREADTQNVILVTIQEGDEMFCAQCGTRLEDSASFCGQCGASAQDSEDAGSGVSPQVQPKRGHSRSLGALIAVLAIGGLIYFAQSGSKQRSQVSPNDTLGTTVMSSTVTPSEPAAAASTAAVATPSPTFSREPVTVRGKANLFFIPLPAGVTGEATGDEIDPFYAELNNSNIHFRFRTHSEKAFGEATLDVIAKLMSPTDTLNKETLESRSVTATPDKREAILVIFRGVENSRNCYIVWKNEGDLCVLNGWNATPAEAPKLISLTEAMASSIRHKERDQSR